MEPNKATLERAFGLARSGKCNNLTSLRLDVNAMTFGNWKARRLLNQLLALIAAAAPPPQAEGF
ncbi:hypothetical protein [Mesorhizobium sp. B1-1-8]|uniref:hypothetical protein n=1 Tax=Mesorhizobium sp. B1-1-8 TaxID=2589976 RepID=UPI0011268C28|nr:hypothetical protein [Mesorhizobium sp. B1-1-8]UCI05168.1 hypothetical protein FJ974_14970 [Mesorhizobium sp. B1-1-8]